MNKPKKSNILPDKFVVVQECVVVVHQISTVIQGSEITCIVVKPVKLSLDWHILFLVRADQMCLKIVNVSVS